MCVTCLGFVLLVWFPVLHAQSAAQSCPAPSLDGGYFLPEQETYDHEAKLTYACDSGRKPAVEGWWATSTCQNGKWSHEPQCIDENACLPPEVPNAKYTESPNGLYEDGKPLRITCDQGYELKDRVATARCTNGAWSSVPVCERSPLACGEPPKIPHAVIIHRGYQEVFAADSKVQYECQAGYTVRGTDNNTVTIICVGGTWTESPTCSRETRPGAGPTVGGAGTSAGRGTPPAGGDREPRPGSGSTAGSGTPSAGGGREPRPGGGSTAGGTGTPAGRGTTPAGGGREPRPGAGSTVGGASGGQTTSAGSGTQPAGRETRPATGHGAVSPCGPNPTVPNAVVVQEGQMFVKYQCNAFYTQVGGDTVFCLGDGTWSQLPVCKESFCVLGPAHSTAGYKIHTSEYLKMGETKYIPCIWYQYSTRVQCTARGLIFSGCCHIYDINRGVCGFQ